jgi:hypothetical protein
MFTQTTFFIDPILFYKLLQLLRLSISTIGGDRLAAITDLTRNLLKEFL